MGDREGRELEDACPLPVLPQMDQGPGWSEQVEGHLQTLTTDAGGVWVGSLLFSYLQISPRLLQNIVCPGHCNNRTARRDGHQSPAGPLLP